MLMRQVFLGPSTLLENRQIMVFPNSDILPNDGQNDDLKTECGEMMHV